jgi:raffinose/stachyose/melibiose transport system permease protein
MLQNGLAAFTDQYGGRDWGATFAAVTIATVPTIAVYLIMNKKIIEGLTAGAVKG